MKKLMLSVFFIAISSTVFAQKSDYQLSTHILDISEGKPAVGVSVELEKYNEQKENWMYIAKKTTGESGRIPNFLPTEKSNLGIYKLTFYTKDYFVKNDKDTFYPFITVVFEIKEDVHYHVPITLSAYGYSTYRGN